MERRREALTTNQLTPNLKKPIVLEHYYHNVFVSEFNIDFGYPCSDTCDTCDPLKVKISDAENDEDKFELEKESQEHLALAEQGYESLRKDCERAKCCGHKLTIVKPRNVLFLHNEGTTE